MPEIICIGLEGTSPLGMLASLGLFRMLTNKEPGTRMGWKRDKGWHPMFRADTSLEPGPLSQWLVDTIRCLGSVQTGDIQGKQRAARAAKAKIKPLEVSLKKAKAQARSIAKSKGLKGPKARAYVHEVISNLEAQLQMAKTEHETRQAQLADALGQGVAHLGDVIGVKPEVFRYKAQSALARYETGEMGLILDCLASQASDASAVDGWLEPTPFSFGNGAGNQCLLKDFRAMATSLEKDEMESILTNRTPLRREGTSLNWDPMDQRSYALQRQNPEKEANPVEFATNVLAFFGLTCLPAMPGTGQLKAVGFGEGRAAWTWPIWESLLPMDLVRSLLSHPKLQEEIPSKTCLAAVGIGTYCRARRFSTNKRLFFSPAEER